MTDPLNGSITSNATTITVTDGDKFEKGHIIRIDSEDMWVSAVNITTEVLTVTRAYQGSAVTHNTAATVEIVGMARLEGDDSNDSPWTARTTGSNYTQIFHQEVRVARSQNQLEQYGIDEEIEYQASKAVPNLVRQLEKGLYRGARKAGSSSTPRAAGGLSVFITDNLVAGGGGAITQVMFENALKLSYADGGLGPWLAFCEPAKMQTIKNFYDAAAFLRVDRDEQAVGMVIEKVMTPFGVVDLVMDRWAEVNRVNIVDPKHAGFLTYYPFTNEPLSKGGDYERSEVVGEFTICVRQDKAHAAITNLI